MANARVTEAMVRRFCKANTDAEHGPGIDCDGECHEGIRAGLKAVLSGVGEPCSPYFCECAEPKPDPTYHNRCKAVVDEEEHRRNHYYGLCHGFIKGVSQRRDGRKR